MDTYCFYTHLVILVFNMWRLSSAAYYYMEMKTPANGITNIQLEGIFGKTGTKTLSENQEVRNKNMSFENDIGTLWIVRLTYVDIGEDKIMKEIKIKEPGKAGRTVTFQKFSKVSDNVFESKAHTPGLSSFRIYDNSTSRNKSKVYWKESSERYLIVEGTSFQRGTPNYEWYKRDEVTGKVNRSGVPSGGKMLLFKNVKIEERGAYFCIISLGDNIVKTNEISVTVLYIKMEPIEVKISGGAFIQEGSDVQIKCKGSSFKPKLQVTLRKGKDNMHNLTYHNQSCSGSTKEGTFDSIDVRPFNFEGRYCKTNISEVTIELKSIKQIDTGIYYCESMIDVTNETSAITATTNISITTNGTSTKINETSPENTNRSDHFLRRNERFKLNVIYMDEPNITALGHYIQNNTIYVTGEVEKIELSCKCDAFPPVTNYVIEPINIVRQDLAGVNFRVERNLKELQNFTCVADNSFLQMRYTIYVNFTYEDESPEAAPKEKSEKFWTGEMIAIVAMSIGFFIVVIVIIIVVCICMKRYKRKYKKKSQMNLNNRDNTAYREESFDRPPPPPYNSAKKTQNKNLQQPPSSNSRQANFNHAEASFNSINKAEPYRPESQSSSKSKSYQSELRSSLNSKNGYARMGGLSSSNSQPPLHQQTSNSDKFEFNEPQPNHASILI